MYKLEIFSQKAMTTKVPQSHQILSPLKVARRGGYGIQTLYRRGVRARVGLGFSIDETIGDNLRQGTIHGITLQLEGMDCIAQNIIFDTQAPNSIV